ncbi:MAG: substrate-binding domain-containing protein [Pseudomonadota bacterium]|nr:substrate-binding domain-containing protein [Pseudomonadota bacterium]
MNANALAAILENLHEYEKAGAILMATRRDLGAVAMGAAVRQGAKVPDISTPEALRKTLTDVSSLTYMDPTRGTSGKHFDESVLPALGIRDAVRAKTRFGEGGFIAEKVARGEVEIAFHQMTEMLPVPGVTIVGPLPSALQKTTVYSGVVMSGAKNPQHAQQLLDYLASPAGRKAFLDRGFTAP